MQYTQDTITLSNGDTASYTRITNDVNGNPRYVIHYLTAARLLGLDKASSADTSATTGIPVVEALYAATKKAAGIYGWKAYRAKWYGGGLVIRSYNIRADLETLRAVGEMNAAKDKLAIDSRPKRRSARRAWPITLRSKLPSKKKKKNNA